ncbi:MAG: hypothetical protein ACOCXH_15665, partial [Cyclobacteriaceae bacterium]
CLILFLLFNGYTTYQTISIKQEKKLIVFAIPGQQAAMIHLYGNGYWLNDELKPEDKLATYNVSGYNLKHAIQIGQDCPLAHFNLEDHYSIYQVEDKKIISLQKLPQYEFKKPIAADYLIIGHNAVRSLAVLEKYFTPGEIILDSSNFKWLTDRLTTEASNKNILIHSVTSSGAKVIDL